MQGLGAAAVPAPGDSRDQLHNQEQQQPWEAAVSPSSQDMALNPTAMLSLKFKAVCSNPPVLYQDGFLPLMLPELSPRGWESAQAPLAQELQDFGLGLFVSVRFCGPTRACRLGHFKGSWLCKLQGGILRERKQKVTRTSEKCIWYIVLPNILKFLSILPSLFHPGTLKI